MGLFFPVGLEGAAGSQPLPTNMEMQEARTGIFPVPVAMGHPTEGRRAHGVGLLSP